jgi:hypothetical protein
MVRLNSFPFDPRIAGLAYPVTSIAFRLTPPETAATLLPRGSGSGSELSRPGNGYLAMPARTHLIAVALTFPNPSTPLQPAREAPTLARALR